MLKTHIVIFAHFGSAKSTLDSTLIAESGADSLFVESSGLDSLFVESNDDFCALFAESGVDFLFVESALDLSHFSASRQSLSLSLVTPHC